MLELKLRQSRTKIKNEAIDPLVGRGADEKPAAGYYVMEKASFRAVEKDTVFNWQVTKNCCFFKNTYLFVNH